MTKYSKQLKDLIIKSEGLRTKPYKDVVGIPTIGVGATFYKNGNKVKMTDKELSLKEVALF